MEKNEAKYLHIRPPKQALWALVAFLTITSLFMLAKLKNEMRGYNRTTAPTTLSVSGEGKELVKPDIGIVSIGVVKNNLDLVKAQQSAAELINRVVHVLGQQGVAEKDQRTTSFNIYPQYDYRDGAQKFRGYEVRQTIEVKIRDLSKVGVILSGVTAAGANEVSSLTFTVDDPKAAEDKARAAAIAEAKTKAKKLAKDLGVRLKRIVSYNESNGGYPPPIFYAKAEFGMGGSSAPAVPTGENEIRKNVTITYEIK